MRLIRRGGKSVFSSLEMANKQKGDETPKAAKIICRREQKDSPKAERNCMSFKQKREILDAYSKLPKMTKEQAASKLNISRPLLTSNIGDIFLAIKDGSFWEYHTYVTSDTRH